MSPVVVSRVRVSRVGAALRSFGAFWWDFVVGDDWRTAVGVVTALAATALLAGTGVPAWWLLPLAVLGLFAASLHRTTRGARVRTPDGRRADPGDHPG